MDVGVLAVRYAKALLDYALEKGVEEEVYSQMGLLLECLKQNPALTRTLEDPLLSRQDKLSLLSSTLTGDDKANDAVQRFYSIIIENRRENYLRASALNYQTLYREKKNIAVVRITTAIPLSKEMEEKIISKTSSVLGKKIELYKCVNPSIEGGFIIDVDDFRMDASIASKLRQIRQQLLDKNRRIV